MCWHAIEIGLLLHFTIATAGSHRGHTVAASSIAIAGAIITFAVLPQLKNSSIYPRRGAIPILSTTYTRINRTYGSVQLVYVELFLMQYSGAYSRHAGA